MYSRENSRVFVAAAVGAVLIPLISLLFFTPFYQTNDDVAMRLLAEGNFVPGGSPVPFLMHINVIIGALLRILYGAVPSLPWYDLVLGASMTAATAAFVCVWVGARKWYELAWTAIFGAFFLLPTFVNVQFSLVGLGCAAAGVALLARALFAPLEQRLLRAHVVGGAALVLWGAIVRAEGAALMLLEGAVLALPFAVVALRDPALRPRLKRVLLAGGAALVLGAIAFGVNQLVYQRANGWEEFHRYNFLRSRMSEYMSSTRVTPEVTATLPQAVGWTGNDFALFQNWFFTDPNLYSLERVQRAERLLFSAAGEPQAASKTPPLIDIAKQYLVELEAALLVLVLFAIAWRGRLALILYLAFELLAFGGLIALITLLTKAPPERILWPMVMLLAAMLSLASQRWGRTAQPVVTAIALAVAVWLTGTSVSAIQAKNVERRKAAAEALQDVEQLRRSGATFYVLHGDAFPYEDYWRPLHMEKSPFPFVALGVSARTPPVQNFLRRTGRTDLPLSLCTEPKTLLLARPYVPPMLVRFSEEHHSRHVQYTPVFEGKRFTAWKCGPAAP